MQALQQLNEVLRLCEGRGFAGSRHEKIGNAALDHGSRLRARLDHGDTRAGSGNDLRGVDQRPPITQQLGRRTCFPVEEEADLDNVEVRMGHIRNSDAGGAWIRQPDQLIREVQFPGAVVALETITPRCQRS